jgi:hypothetical protein
MDKLREKRPKAAYADAAAFFGVAFFLGAAVFLGAVLGVVLLTRPDLVLLRTAGLSAAAGFSWEALDTIVKWI